MRQPQLRRFFLNLAAVAVPVPLIVVACGGSVSTVSQDEGSGGSGGGSGGARDPGPSTGGYGGYVGIGGFVGQAPGTGGYLGMGGYVGSGGYDGIAGYVGRPPSGGSGGNDERPDAGPDVDSGADPDFTDGGLCEGGVAPRGAGLCGAGRRPPGLVPAKGGELQDVRRYFEEMARLEAGSVPAFRILGRELCVHGAPRALLAAARRSAREEIRHTRAARVLAERYGGRYVPPRILKRPQRTLEELALDNAAEGCVRETFGAMIATYQARAAGDPVVRKLMRSIAVDETRHAALAIRVAEWTDRRLPDAAVRRVRDLRRSTAADVRRELETHAASPELVALAGIPSREESLRLVAAMTERLWS
jgi:hypothetical protein